MKACQIKIIFGLIFACILAIGAIVLFLFDKEGSGWFLLGAFLMAVASGEIECE